MYCNVKFFLDKDLAFILWVAKLTKPFYCEESDYIYKEGDEVHDGK